jgi:hypothetical protein
MRKRFRIWALRRRGWVLRLRGRALPKADRPRKVRLLPPREAPRLEDTCSQQCRLACRSARMPFNRATNANMVHDLHSQEELHRWQLVLVLGY